MQKILSINEIKVYSRKQVIAWVQSYGFNFDQIKNGLFFIRILRKIAPQDVNKCKVYQRCVNQYEQTQNMNIVKKILNKHNLQLNMNVQSIILSKNNFQLANWFKNLYEQNKSDTDTQFHYSQKSHTPSKFTGFDDVPVSIANYKSLSRATSSDKNVNSGSKKLGRVTSGFVGLGNSQKLNYTIKLPKSNLDGYLNYQMLSVTLQNQSKDDRNRTLKPSQLRLLSRSKSRNSKTNKGNNWFNSPSSKKPQAAPTQQQNLANLMKMEALTQQISVYEQILKNISTYIKREQITDMDKMKKQITSIIYKVPIAKSTDKNQ